jgi:dihydroxyacetone kinase
MAMDIGREASAATMRRVATVLTAGQQQLTELDQAVGDGDLGITAAKIAQALETHAASEADDDLGKFLSQGGMAINRVASSTMGTLIATALMRAAREIRGKSTLTPPDLAAMLSAADQGIQERGKAKPGDKTVIDTLHPAAEAFAAAITAGETPARAATRMLDAARQGLASVTPLRNKVGRASWVGERTEGKVDPGCALMVMILEAIVG